MQWIEEQFEYEMRLDQMAADVPVQIVCFPHFSSRDR